MTVTQDKFDTGNRALNRFRRLIQTRYKPLLRAVTGNDKLEVEPHASGAFTDNKTVWIPIPLALGDETLEHDKSLCGQRDAVTLKMLCPMCAVEDATDGLVFHESAHITERSFDKMTRGKLVKLIDDVFGQELSKLSADMQRKLRDRIRSCSGDVMEAAHILDTWLPFALNCVEDVYVNRRLFQYREGTEVPLRVQTREIFENGMELASGEVKNWKDNDPTAQAIMSAYLIGHDLAELGVHLNVDLTDDPTLIDLMGSIPSNCEVGDRLHLAMELVVYLRTLGYCPPRKDDIVLPQPPQPKQQTPPPPSGGESEPQPGQGESGESEPTEGDDGDDGEGDGNDSEGDDADDEQDGEGSGSGDDDDSEEGDDDGASGSGDDDEGDEDGDGASGDDGGDDSEAGDGVEKGVESNSKGGDNDSGKSAEGDDTDADASDSSDNEGDNDSDIEEQARRAKELLTYVMGHDDKGPQHGNSSSDEMVLERVLKQEGFSHPSDALEGGYKKVTNREYIKQRQGARSVETKVPRNMLTPSLARLRVVFASNRKTGIERSLRNGSRIDTMHLYRAGTDDPRFFGRRNVPKSRDWFVCVGLDFSGSTMHNGAEYATRMAGHAIGELLYELGIRFAMYAHSSAYTDHGDALQHIEIKSPDDNWKAHEVQDALWLQRGGGINLDGHSLEQYRKVLESQRATDKLMLYFTDGEMPNANFSEEIVLLKENIELLKRQRVHLLGVGYRTDSPKRHGLETIQYNKPDDIASIVKGLETHLKS